MSTLRDIALVPNLYPKPQWGSPCFLLCVMKWMFPSTPRGGVFWRQNPFAVWKYVKLFGATRSFEYLCWPRHSPVGMSRKKTSPQITSASKMYREESDGCDQKLCFIFSLSAPLLGAPVLAPASQRLAWGGHNPLSVGTANKMCCVLWATQQVYWNGMKP